MFEGKIIKIKKCQEETFLVHEVHGAEGQEQEQTYALGNMGALVTHLERTFGVEEIGSGMPMTMQGRNQGKSHLIDAMRYGFGMDMGCGDKKPDPEKEMNDMRDELGELRRFKKEAMDKRGELTNRINSTIDSLNRVREECGRLQEENASLILKNVELVEKLAAKTSSKRK